MPISNCYNYLKEHQDYIPVVSTLASGVKLFRFAICNNEQIFQKHSYKSLSKGSISRSIVLLIPVLGNIVIALYDFKKHQKHLSDLNLVTQRGLALKDMSDEQTNDEVFVDRAVTQNIRALQYASINFRNNEEYIIEKMRVNPAILRHASDEIREDRDFIFDRMQEFNDPSIIRYAHTNLLRDEHFIFQAMKINVRALQYADYFRDEKDFVLKLAGSNFPLDFFLYVDKILRNDSPFMKKLIVIRPEILKLAKSELRRDEQFIEEEMSINPQVLMFSLLCSNRDFVERQIRLKNDFSIVRFASDVLRKDIAFLSRFKDNKFCIFQYAHQDLKSDLSVIAEMIENNKLSLKWMSDSAKGNADIVFLFINENLSELPLACSSLLKNTYFIKKVVVFHPDFLTYCGKDIQNHHDLILNCIRINHKVYELTNQEFKNKFFLDALRENIRVVEYCSFADNAEEYEPFLLEMISKDPSVLIYDVKLLRKDPEFMKKAILFNRCAIKYASIDMLGSPEFIFDLMKRNPSYLQDATDILKKDPNLILRYITKNGVDANYVKINATSIHSYIHQDLLKDKDFVEKLDEMGVLSLFKNNNFSHNSFEKDFASEYADPY